MKLIISQRTGLDKHKQEIDSLEKNYVDYFSERGFLVIPVPNNPSFALGYLDEADIFVLSGGNEDPGGRRDLTETPLISEAIIRGIPILGICRGLQKINTFFGGSLGPVFHEKQHEIVINNDYFKIKQGTVSSFHTYCIKDLAPPLKVFATADGTIEGIFHPYFNIVGIQWHPERLDSSWVDDSVMKVLKNTKDLNPKRR